MNKDSVLKDLLRKFPHAEPCRSDALRAMHTYRDLVPQKQKFVYNDGRECELVALNGTIPVQYKGVRYNIPVSIWLQENHPFIPPLVYVMPTTTMAIRQSKHVDANGRVFLPYLTEWVHPRSDLAAMIQILCCVFAEQPPVYTRQPGQTPPVPQPMYSPRPGQPFPGYPGVGNTPYPPRPGPMSMPSPMPGGAPVGAGGSRPPYQPYPPSGGTKPPYAPVSQPSFLPTGSSYPPASQPQLAVNTTSSPQTLSTQSSISEDTIRSSLVSAVEDKLRRQIKATFEQAQIEQNELSKTQQELKTGSEKLEDMLKKLEKEQVDVDNNIKLLTQKNEEIADVVTKLESESSDLNIDEAVVTTAPLYNQILNLFAEENAVEDTIYYLSEGLRKEAIALEVFLKHVRTLSRRQFMLRALLQKARQAAGLS